MICTVVIVTLNRPDCVSRCLECLRVQSLQPEQVIVVDASADDRTANVVQRFDGVDYIHSNAGFGHMTYGRNLGLARATGDFVAFLDDDAFAHEGWLAALIEPYADPTIGGVGGRALNGLPGEASIGIERIGRILRTGEVTGNFGADPGRVIEVDHIIGCNMSWRREVLARLGPLREVYRGTEAREDTDISLRVRSLGYRILFNPAAVVDHIGAPRAVGNRFGPLGTYYGSRNTVLLYVLNYGLLSRLVWATVVASLGVWVTDLARRTSAGMLRLALGTAGLVAGLFGGIWLLVKREGDFRFHDKKVDNVVTQLDPQPRV